MNTRKKGESPPKSAKHSEGRATRSAKNSMVIRDTFSMPDGDYKRIEALRSLAARQGHIHTKSELIRAGLVLLSSLTPEGLVKALSQVERVKPGRKVE